MSPSLLVDADVPGLVDACAEFAQVHPFTASTLDAPDELLRAALRRAHGLVVRTVTRVDAALLERAPQLRAVATASAGYDHVDQGALAHRGVAFITAGGCNATAVAEHVVTWVAHWLTQRAPLRRRPVGVVGFGHTGRRVAWRLQALGLEVVVSDPPLARRRARATTPSVGDPNLDAWAQGVPLVAFEDLVDRCGLVSLHVPLTRDGPHATQHLVDAATLQRRPDVVWLNAARGGVIDDAALCEGDHGVRASLDVFDGEPIPNARLLTQSPVLAGPAWPCSPHIAGYSLEAKLRAGAMVAERLAVALGAPAITPARQRVATALPPAPPPTRVQLSPDVRCPWSALRAALFAVHDVAAIDVELRRHLHGLAPGPQLAAAFTERRRRYVLRREFSAHTLSLHAPGLGATERDRVRKWLSSLGLSGTR